MNKREEGRTDAMKVEDNRIESGRKGEKTRRNGMIEGEME